MARRSPARVVGSRLLQALPERVFGIMANELLLSIPFFTLMGAILERCGLAEDMLEGMGQLFGPGKVHERPAYTSVVHGLASYARGRWAS